MPSGFQPVGTDSLEGGPANPRQVTILGRLPKGRRGWVAFCLLLAAVEIALLGATWNGACALRESLEANACNVIAVPFTPMDAVILLGAAAGVWWGKRWAPWILAPSLVLGSLSAPRWTFVFLVLASALVLAAALLLPRRSATSIAPRDTTPLFAKSIHPRAHKILGPLPAGRRGPLILGLLVAAVAISIANAVWNLACGLTGSGFDDPTDACAQAASFFAGFWAIGVLAAAASVGRGIRWIAWIMLPFGFVIPLFGGELSGALISLTALLVFVASLLLPAPPSPTGPPTGGRAMRALKLSAFVPLGAASWFVGAWVLKAAPGFHPEGPAQLAFGLLVLMAVWASAFFLMKERSVAFAAGSLTLALISASATFVFVFIGSS